MATSPHQHPNPSATWTPPLNRLPSHSFGTVDDLEGDPIPKALQSRPFGQEGTQQIVVLSHAESAHRPTSN